MTRRRHGAAREHGADEFMLPALTRGVKHRGSDLRGHENAFGRIDSNCVPNKVSVQGTSSE